MYAEVLEYHNAAGDSTKLTPQLDGMDLTP